MQAKRYAIDRTVDLPKIHEFARVPLGKQGDRGVFIATSRFSPGAKNEAERINTRIELSTAPGSLSCSSYTEWASRASKSVL